MAYLVVATIALIGIGTLIAGVIVVVRANVALGVVMIIIGAILTGVLIFPLFQTVRRTPRDAFEAEFHNPPGPDIREIYSSTDASRTYLWFRATDDAMDDVTRKPFASVPLDECRTRLAESKQSPAWFHPAFTPQCKCWLAEPDRALLWNPETREAHYIRRLQSADALHAVDPAAASPHHPTDRTNRSTAAARDAVARQVVRARREA